MDQDSVIEMLRKCLLVCEELNGVAVIANRFSDDQRKDVRRAVGHLILNVWDELIHPLLESVPELDPTEVDARLGFLRKLSKAP